VNAESDALFISFGSQQVINNGRFSMQTFFITPKSLGGHDKTFVTPRFKVKKVKFFHIRERAFGPELIPVYRQSARR